MINCKKATELIELQNEVKLSFKERWQLKIHLMMCKVCHKYIDQSNMLSLFLKKHFALNNIEMNFKNASNTLKQRILTELDKIK
jgi:hypothetical protein